jgi:hypothetical protein
MSRHRRAPGKLTVEQVVEAACSTADADSVALASAVRKARLAGHLIPDDADWVDRQEVRGLQQGLAARLDTERTQLPGRPLTSRKFIVMLDEEGKHSWSTIELVLADSQKKNDAIRHCWSVVDEHVSGLRKEAQLMVDLGEDEEKVKDRIRRLVAEVFG